MIRWLLILMAISCELMLRHNDSRAAQSSDNLCGAECLYVSLRSVGRAPKDFSQLLAKLGPPGDVQGYSILELENVAKIFGCNTASIHVNAQDTQYLKSLAVKYQVILLYNQSHFMICSGLGETKVTLIDPSKGLTYVDLPQFLNAWDGKCLLVSNSPIELETKSARTSFGKVLGLIVVLLLVFSLGLFLFRRRRMGVAVSTLLVASLCIGCDAGTNRSKNNGEVSGHPDFVLTAPADFDAGAVPPSSGGIEHLFHFTNKGSANLEIRGVRTSCQCTSAKVSPKVIEPGKTGTVFAKMETTELGPHFASVAVLTNAPLNPEVLFTTKWSIRGEIWAEPTKIEMVKIVPGESPTFPIVVLARDVGRQPDITSTISVTKGCDGVSCTIVKKDEKTFELGVVASDDAESGTWVGAVEFCFKEDSTSDSTFLLPITLAVRSKFSVYPATIVLEPQQGELQKRQFVVSAIDPELLKTLKIYLDDALQNEITPSSMLIKESGTAIVQLALPASSDALYFCSGSNGSYKAMVQVVR